MDTIQWTFTLDNGADCVIFVDNTTWIDMKHGTDVQVKQVPFQEAFWLWVKVALDSFGGPTGQIAVMHRYLVEEKRWISESRFLHALNYCMLLPGPEAQQLAVEPYSWLKPGEMLDGLELAETTPGPLILVLQFVGFLGAYRSPGGLDPMLAGVFGAVVTVWVTFVPCFLWIFLGAPYVEALRGNRSLGTAMSGITAAVMGVVLNLAVWFALHTLFGSIREVYALGAHLLVPDWVTINAPTLLIAIFAMFALFRFKLGMMKTIGCCAGLGVVYNAALWVFA